MVFVGLRRPPPLRLRRHRHDGLLGQPDGVHAAVVDRHRRGGGLVADRGPRRASSSARSTTSSTPTSRGSFTRPACPTNPHSGLSPCQLQDAYRLPSQVTGAGRTVAIVDAFDDPKAESDLAVYRAGYGLPPCTTANGCFTKLNQTGVAGCYPAGRRGLGRGDLARPRHGLGHLPGCATSPWSRPTSTRSPTWPSPRRTAAATSPDGHLQQLGRARVQRRALLRQLVLLRRDPGDLLAPATRATAPRGRRARPSVTAVGGTALAADSSARGWSETVWAGANSGCSSQEPKPAWQTDSGCAKRTIADVSALAGSPGESIYDTYGRTPGGRTSAAPAWPSPIIASVYALAYPDSSMSTTYADHRVAVRRHLRRRTVPAAAPTSAPRGPATTAPPAWARRVAPRPSARVPFTTACGAAAPAASPRSARGRPRPSRGPDPVVWRRADRLGALRRREDHPVRRARSRRRSGRPSGSATVRRDADEPPRWRCWWCAIGSETWGADRSPTADGHPGGIFVRPRHEDGRSPRC